MFYFHNPELTWKSFDTAFRTLNIYVPENLKGSSLSINIRMVAKILSWKLKVLNQPSEFFNHNGEPTCKPHVLDKKS
ncbi:hypothetical protein EBI01_04930 [Marinomonas rhizomae]|nr:hypothetical protein EBI01_04930 [Marinomonas rhizomae]